MSIPTFLLLIAAGVGSGLVGYLTGLASLVSYPALLAAGLSPVAANVSNTLGLIGVGIGSTARAGSTLREKGPGRLGVQVVVAAVGGLAGGALLLLGGEGTFERIVPALILAASLLVLVSPRLSRLRGERESAVAYAVGLFFVSVYGGYFGAGAGVLFLALALTATSETFQRAMILKSVLLGVTNLTAALLFIALGPINWLAAIALGLGAFVGGNLGPVVQRLIPEMVLRVVVAISGTFLAVWLWVR
ncbi:sulfite exporter TauE/SafE family protein [Mariniluteicoccus endophyticus]